METKLELYEFVSQCQCTAAIYIEEGTNARPTVFKLRSGTSEGMENPRFEEIKLWFLGTVGLIESAMKIPFRNPNFIALTLITSFPLFCMRLIHELPYNNQPSWIKEAIYQLRILTYDGGNMTWALNLTIQILKVYLFCLVDFLSALTTIYAASIIYTSNERSTMGLRNLLRNSITKTRWHERMFTFLYVSFLCSLSSNVVDYWRYARPLLSSGCPTPSLRGLHLIVYGVAFAKWAEYSAWWNLSVVVSILEENRGFEAISASSKLTKGNRLRGLIWMVLYSVWSFKLPSLLATWTFPHILAYYYLDTSFLCLGKVINWVVLTVYYYDCKNCRNKVAISS
ncbi:hypothetical protein CerSpe_027360 [Prunus speciosa]